MSTCFTCQQGADITLSYTQQRYCRPCFLAYLEQRILKDLRKHKTFKAKDRLYFTTDNPRTHHAKRLLKFLEKNDIRITEEREGAILCDAKSLDQVGAEFLATWLSKDEKSKPYVLPIRCILDEELNILANMWGLPAIPLMEGKIAAFINDVRKKHPQVPFSLLASIDNL